jgi:hypothetical protein
MRHTLSTLAASAVGIVALAVMTVGGVGCTTADALDHSLLILQNQAPGAQCTVSTSRTSTVLGRGFIDARSQRGYLFTPLVQNFAVTGDNIEDTQRIAFIEGAEVDLGLDDTLDSGQASALDAQGVVHFSELFSVPVFPDGGVAALSFTVVPAEVLAALGEALPDGSQEFSTIDAAVTIFGTMGGGDFESQVFHYQIDVCDGCAVFDNGLCELLAPDFVANQGGNCNPLQDPPGVVDCCTNDLGLLQCPAVSTTAPAGQ